MNAREWIAAYSDKVGVEAPTPREFATLLDVASEAAHASERVAAPVACWVAARAGISTERALEAAREVSAHG